MEDEAKTEATGDYPVAFDEYATDPMGPAAFRLGGTVVAGPPDDSHHLAMLEIAAALNGDTL